jgi:phospholipid/cholesterol/gamma-HCH transport system substrate-binding protein
LKNAGALPTPRYIRCDSSVRYRGCSGDRLACFNGIRVGEVTELELSGADLRQVRAIIAVDRRTPILMDTVVSIDFQGLTGSPVIALISGTSEQPRVAANGRPAILIADAAASQSMSQAARDVPHPIDGLLAENAQPLRSIIGNLDTFAGALARDSDRLDGIVAGLERMTRERAAKAPLVTYDLTAPCAAEATEKPSKAGSDVGAWIARAVNVPTAPKTVHPGRTCGG